MKNQFLVDTIYNHNYLRKILGILLSIKRNNKLEYVEELCEKNEIYEDEEIFHMFLNELNNICNRSNNNKEKQEKNIDDVSYEESKDSNSAFTNNSDKINKFEMESNTSSHKIHKKNRIYIDGIFDLSHSGHFNAMRQAKRLGDVLVVGINSDEDAFHSKGVIPIYTQEERGKLIRGCKWVDEVIVGTKYTVDMELLKKYNCDYAAHGSDMVYDHNGRCCYEEVKKHKKLKIFERSYGISSTTIINHLLQAVDNSKNTNSSIEKIPSNKTNDNNSYNNYNSISISNNSDSISSFNNGNGSNSTNLKEEEGTTSNNDKTNVKTNDKNNDFLNNSNNIDNHNNNNIESVSKLCENTLNVNPDLNKSKCYLTSSLLYQFIDNNEKKNKINKVVYVDGSFDIFHIGHLKILQNAKKLGDFLLVGIHDDDVVRKMKGKYFPVVTLLERTLNVLAMKIVDDVVIGAPWIITENFIKRFNIVVVVRGTIVDYIYSNNEVDPYAIPKKLNIYKEISSQSSITTFEIIERIKKNKKYLMNNIYTRNKKEENICNVSNTYVLT